MEAPVKEAIAKINQYSEITLTVTPRIYLYNIRVRTVKNENSFSGEKTQVSITGNIDSTHKKLPSRLECSFHWVFKIDGMPDDKITAEAAVIFIKNESEFEIKRKDNTPLELDIFKHNLLGTGQIGILVSSNYMYTAIDCDPHPDSNLKLNNLCQLNVANYQNARMGQKVNFELKTCDALKQLEYEILIWENDIELEKNPQRELTDKDIDEAKCIKIPIKKDEKKIWRVGCVYDENPDKILFNYPESEKGYYEYNYAFKVLRKTEKPRINKDFCYHKKEKDFIKKAAVPSLKEFKIGKTDANRGKLKIQISDLSSDVITLGLIIEFYDLYYCNPTCPIRSFYYTGAVNSGSISKDLCVDTEKPFFLDESATWFLQTSSSIYDLFALFYISNNNVLYDERGVNGVLLLNTVKHRILEKKYTRKGAASFKTDFEFINNGKWVCSEEARINSVELIDHPEVEKAIYIKGKKDEAVYNHLVNIQKNGIYPEYAVNNDTIKAIQRGLNQFGYKLNLDYGYGQYKNSVYAGFIAKYNAPELIGYPDCIKLFVKRKITLVNQVTTREAPVTDQDLLYELREFKKSTLEIYWMKITGNGLNTIFQEIIRKAGKLKLNYTDISPFKEALRKSINDALGIIKREDWGKKKPKYAEMEQDWGYDIVAVHHSGNKGITDPVGIEKKHMEEEDYDDVGYHYLIAPNGVIYEGRKIYYKGSHIKEANTYKIGINILGDFQPGGTLDFSDDVPTTAQMEKLVKLINVLKEKFRTLSLLGGHRDFTAKGNSTECPGETLYNLLPNIRKIVDLKAPGQK